MNQISLPALFKDTQYLWPHRHRNIKILSFLGSRFMFYKLAHSATGYKSIHNKLKMGVIFYMAFPIFLTTQIQN